MGLNESDWLALVTSIASLGLGAYMSTLPKHLGRRIGIGLALFGCAAGIFWFGYYRNVQSTPAPTVNYGPSINTTNQSGGINTINIGPTKLTFRPAIAEELIGKLPPGKPVRLRGIGSPSDQTVVDQYQQFLEGRGFQIVRDIIGQISPPPDNQITIANNRDMTVVTIAPRAY